MNSLNRNSWITWRIYLLALPVNIAVLMTSVDHQIVSVKQVLGWGLIALITHIAIAPLVAAGIVISRDLRNWKFDLFYLVLIGAGRGEVITLMAQKFKYELEVSSTYKIFNSMLGVPLWFILIAVSVESRRSYQNEFKSLFIKAMDLQREQSKRAKLMPDSVSDSEELIVRLQYLTNSLAADIQNIVARKGNLSDYSQQVNRIQSLIDENIKPASSDLWNRSELNSPKIPLKTLLEISLFRRPLRIIPVVLLSLPYLFVGLHATTNYPTTFFQCIITGAIDIGAFLVLEGFYKASILNRFQTNLTILISIPVLSFIIQEFFVPAKYEITLDPAKFWIYQIFLSVTFTILVYIVKSYKVVNSDRSDILIELREHLNEDKYAKLMKNNIKNQDQNEFAEFLHGEIQAGLTASSLLLQQAASAGDSDLAQEALERAAGLLSQDHTSLYYTRMATPDQRLQKIIEGWKGIAEISINIPNKDLLEPSALRNTATLIEEAITNAIRHAKSSQISVTGFIQDGYLSVSIVSDGDQFTKGKSGLGTKIFNDLTQEWKSTRDGSLNNLTFRIANN